MPKSTGSVRRRPGAVSPSRKSVMIGFVSVGLLALMTTISALAQTRALQDHAQDLVDDMMGSIRLIGELDGEIERRRILIDDHIFESSTEEMNLLEQRIGVLNARIAATMRAYDRWAVLPGEREAWAKAERDLMEVDEPERKALALSRQNHDAAARQVMERVSAQFALVDQDLDHLIAINNEGAAEDLARFSMIRVRLTYTLLGIGIVALAGVVGVGVWAWRTIGAREDQLARDARVLEERNRELDAFAGRVAHDIRGPLTAITLAMKPLAAKVPENDRALQVLRRGAKTMGALIDDLLALARSNAEASGWCDPVAVARAVEEELRPRVDAERGELRVALSASDAHFGVACSEGLLRQAVVNLVENAIKYRRPEAPPVVEIAGAPSPERGTYELRVSDNGLGMSAEETEHAAEPFYRSPRARALPGTGLGLSIVDRVAKASGGTLSIWSAPGRGSTFVLQLPLASPPPAPSRSSAAAPSPRSPTSTGPR